MVDRQSEFRIGRLAPLFGRLGERDHYQPPVDLAAPVHPRGVFLADIAAFGKADAIQLDRIGFKPQDIAQLRTGFRDAESKAMCQPRPVRRTIAVIRRCEPTLPERRVSRVGRSAIALMRLPVDRNRRVDRNGDLAA